MKVLYWSIRDIADDNSEDALRNFCQMHNPDFLYFAEPWVDLALISTNYWRFMGLIHVVSNKRMNKAPNLWLFAKVSFDDAYIVHADSQQITVEISLLHLRHHITLVYASVHYQIRWKLWESILSVYNNWSGAFMVIGDFNSVLGAHEKMGKHPPFGIAYTEFQEFIDACSQLNVDTKGAYFSWTNGRGSNSHVEQKLDRTLCNAAWLDKWDTVATFMHPKVGSDHIPIVFHYSMDAFSGPKPFRFLKVWRTNESFYNTVEEAWRTFGNSPFTHKLRMLKNVLRKWNTKVFGNILHAVESAHKPLEEVQSKISIEGYSDSLFHQEIEAKNILNTSLRNWENFL